jgi:hypothetical protein
VARRQRRTKQWVSTREKCTFRLIALRRVDFLKAIRCSERNSLQRNEAKELALWEGKELELIKRLQSAQQAFEECKLVSSKLSSLSRKFIRVCPRIPDCPFDLA